MKRWENEGANEGRRETTGKLEGKREVLGNGINIRIG